MGNQKKQIQCNNAITDLDWEMKLMMCNKLRKQAVRSVIKHEASSSKHSPLIISLNYLTLQLISFSNCSISLTLFDRRYPPPLSILPLQTYFPD